MKKFLSILLTVSMLLALSLTAFADEGDVTAEPPAETAEPEMVLAAEVPAEEEQTEVPAAEEPPAPASEEEPAPAEEPAVAPEELPAEGPAEGTEEAPAEETAGEVSEETAGEPAAEPAAEEPAAEPAEEPAAPVMGIAPIFIDSPDLELKDVQDPGELEDPNPDKDKEGLGVWLHVVNGNFTGDHAQQSSVWVDFADAETRTLPADMSLYVPTRTNGTFLGWYTQAPTETHVTTDTYDVWKTEAVNGQEVPAGGTVPEGVQTLYAAFKDKEEAQEEDKLVTYYMDWNGIGGMWGHCLTSTRKFDAGVDGYALKAEDLLIRYLNWNGEEKSFSSMEDLTAYWGSTEFDGYTFRGWATAPGAPAPDVTVGHVVKSGDSLYAVWTRGDTQSKDFDRTDPEAGPVESLRVDTASGSHTTGTMTWSAHESTGSTLQFNAAVFPVRATFAALTWTVSDGKQSVDVSYEPQKAGAVSGTGTLGDVKLTATGKSLTVEYTGANDNAAPVSLSVNVSAVNEDGSTVKATNIDATAIFSHSWKLESETTATTCGDYSVSKYVCAVDGCHAARETKVRLEHVYNSLVASGVVILREPSCTEPGAKQLKCLRCGALKDNGEQYSIPALGHVWEVESVTPASCNKNEVIEKCTREGCSAKQSSLVPASNPELHVWVTYDSYHSSCSTDTQYQSCTTCGAQRTITVSAKNEHAFQYTGSMRYDCQHVLYSFECAYGCGAKKTELREEVGHVYRFTEKMHYDCQHVLYSYECIYGCGSKQVELKKEVNHLWTDWTAGPSAVPGVTQLIRTCKDCGATESKTTASLTVNGGVSTPQPAATPQAAAQAAVSNGTAGLSSPANTKTFFTEGSNAGNAGYAMLPTAVPGAAQNTMLPTAAPGVAQNAMVPAAVNMTESAPAAPVNKVYARSTVASAEGHKPAVSNYAIESPELTGAQSAEDGITVSWNRVAGAAKYRVFCKLDDGGWFKLADTADSSYTWKHAQEGANYSFTVRCISADGKSYTSSYDAEGLSVANSQAVPEVIRAQNVSGGILLDWSLVAGADKYQVLCRIDGGRWILLADTADSSYLWKGAGAGINYSFTVHGVSSQDSAPAA